MFQSYGIVVFGIGQLIFYLMCLILTFCLTKYKILFIQPISVEKSDKKGSQNIYLDQKTKKVLK